METLSSLPTIQHLIDMVSKALGLEAGVIGPHQESIAGTTPYLSKIGLSVPKDSFADYVLHSGEMCFVKDLRSSDRCYTCAKYSVCPFTVGIYRPIDIDKEIKGVVFFLASNKIQNQIFNRYSPDLTKYLDTTAALIANEMAKKSENITARKLEKLLSCLEYCVLILDSHGYVKQCNSACERLLDFKSKEVLGKLMDLVLADTILHNHNDKMSSDVRIHHPDPTLSFAVHPIYEDGIPAEYIVTVKPNENHKKVFLGTKAKETEDKEIAKKIIGQSQIMQNLREQVRKFSVSDSTILILGETGTGKELVAQAIHDLSPRRNGPFISINCSAIPENLLESELFGYEDGAFTGTKKGGKQGKFQLAHNGTLVLDEIGDMPVPLQAKILRVLENRSVEKLGASKPERVNIRIIASTNRNLKELVTKGQFRADLFYRLNVIPIHVPPLRERKSDIPLLIDHFLELLRKQNYFHVLRLDDQVLELLTNYDWPGNVRELKNMIEYIVNTENGDTAGLESLPQDFRKLEMISGSLVGSPLVDSASPIVKTRRPNKTTIEKTLLIYGISTEGKRKAADHLGISLSTLYRLIQKFDI